MALRRCVVAVAHFVAIALLGCGSSFPEPVTVSPPRNAYVPVPYPPPAALAETVPARPTSDAVWIDGSWAWRSGTYVWERGGWVRPPAAARFAPSRVTYLADGTLLFAESTWYGADGRKLQDPKVIAPATTPPNEITPESQTTR